MKRKKIRPLAAFLALLLLMGSAGCGKAPKSSDFITEENLIETSSMKDAETGAAITGKWNGTKNSSLEIVFPKEVAVNTVVLREKGASIRAFELQIPKGDGYETIIEMIK